MQMYMFFIEVTAEVKISLPRPSLAYLRAALSHLQFFLRVQLPCGRARKVFKVHVTLKIQPFCQSQSKVTVVSGNVDQSKPDVHFNSHIDPYIS